MARKFGKKFLGSIFLLLIISSCGFQIIYRENDLKKASYEKELASIRIQKDSGRLTQELRSAIKDTINPDFLQEDAKYILILSLSKGASGTFITSTGASGRNRITLSVAYQLKNIETGEISAKGVTFVADNYDVQENRFGTYTADQYASSNLVKVAAQNIRNSLVNDLIEIRKKDEKIASETTISAKVAK